MHIILRSLALACLILSMSAAAAFADVRYAGPAGPGSAPCTDKSTPCSLSIALATAVAGDDVELAPGDYFPGSGNTVTISSAIDVYGEAGKPRPVIRSQASGTAVSVTNAAATLSYVEVIYPGVNFVVSSAGTVSRSRFIGTNTVSVSGACSINGDFNNSICVSMGGDAFRASSTGSGAGAPYTVRNSVGVSFSSDSDNCGVGLIHSGSFARTYNFINSVLAAATNGACIYAMDTSVITLNLTNSSFGTSLSNGDTGAQPVINSTNSPPGPPGFVNQGGQDFHPAAGSPLIDAGLNDAANGTLDFDGNPRTVGTSTDIGAFEYVPPPAAPAPPALATTISKKLKSKSKSFTAAKNGASFQPASKQPKKKRKKPIVGTLITFTLSQADDVTFTLERAYEGRKSGSKCAKTTRANRAKKKCTYYKTLRGTEKATGLSAGSNTIWWTGRWGGKALAAGSYSLRGTPIKASTGNEPGTLDPRPVKILPK